LTADLDGLQRFGSPIVLMKSKPLGRRQPGPAKPFLYRTVRSRDQRADPRRLPGDPTLVACRHGRMTKLDDAELTEQGIIALSGYRTADAARGYVKRDRGPETRSPDEASGMDFCYQSGTGRGRESEEIPAEESECG